MSSDLASPPDETGGENRGCLSLFPNNMHLALTSQALGKQVVALGSQESLLGLGLGAGGGLVCWVTVSVTPPPGLPS